MDFVIPTSNKLIKEFTYLKRGWKQMFQNNDCSKDNWKTNINMVCKYDGKLHSRVRWNTTKNVTMIKIINFANSGVKKRQQNSPPSMRGSSSKELRDEAEAAKVAFSGRLSSRLPPPPLADISGWRRKSATHTTTTLQATHSFTRDTGGCFWANQATLTKLCPLRWFWISETLEINCVIIRGHNYSDKNRDRIIDVIVGTLLIWSFL